MRFGRRVEDNINDNRASAIFYMHQHLAFLDDIYKHINNHIYITLYDMQVFIQLRVTFPSGDGLVVT